MYVKICGLTTAEAATRAADLGADAVGVVMSEPSPRHASSEQARAVLDAVAGRPVDTVLVVREMPVRQAVETVEALGFDVLQLHGRYSDDDFALAVARLPRVWRATSLAREPELRAGDHGEELVLLDGARAGSGETWDLGAIDRERLGERWILAGGLGPDNVASAIHEAAPWGVDVSSGVESAPGVKDLDAIERFVRAARSA